jgi:hypothetical protein
MIHSRYQKSISVCKEIQSDFYRFTILESYLVLLQSILLQFQKLLLIHEIGKFVHRLVPIELNFMAGLKNRYFVTGLHLTTCIQNVLIEMCYIPSQIFKIFNQIDARVT